MTDSIVQHCLDILKRDDVKNELKMVCKPVIDFIFYEINLKHIYLHNKLQHEFKVDL
jgi:hypothetical protein